MKQELNSVVLPIPEKSKNSCILVSKKLLSILEGEIIQFRDVDGKTMIYGF